LSQTIGKIRAHAMRNGDETKDCSGKYQPKSGANHRRTQAPDGRRRFNKCID
jgi:hypothetical protein